jgi:hypothetical protein
MTDKLKIKKFKSNDVSLKEIGDELEELGENELISIEFSENTEQEDVNNGTEN